ncbi:Mannose-6-phosphate isomerase, cupin superfamily [Paramaledivibacter caminithermalis DSM 15212]|uniref:Mannose-6-phosphate isomerase, cupin superfamily n=2 Tax=Paramaledivibacter TaxID=1884934 RepID=A0A1M6LXY0_PARC5|nr:Mannose-6-phosphate isomerase, cupin superfamily [Paramaledivibacter caminithermalis DSM 15212]
MYNAYQTYPSPYYISTPIYGFGNMYNFYRTYPYPYWCNTPMFNLKFPKQFIKLKDYGSEPFVVNIEDATKQNNTYRTALWTGDNLQVTLMSIKAGEDIGLEVHPTVDQFIRIEEGQGLVKIGDKKDKLDYQKKVYDDYAIMIPAGKWHNVINTGNKPLKLYTIYAPPEHPHGTIHVTKAEADEGNYGH